MKKEKYRIIFSDGPFGNRHKHMDIFATNSDEAFSRAYQMPEASSGLYSDITVHKVPAGASVIGLEIEYEDTCLGKTYHGYMFIKAVSEQQAIDYYNRHLKGGRFWFYVEKTDDTGKCVRGRVVDSYYAAVEGYQVDATKVS